jgi:hypothetical protein
MFNSLGDRGGYAVLCGAMRRYAVLCGPVKIHAPLLPAMIFNVIVGS